MNYPIHCVKTDEEALLYQPRTGVAFYMHHDGYGKFYPVVYLPLATFVRFWWWGQEPIVRHTWSAGLRVRCDLLRLNCVSSLDEALSACAPLFEFLSLSRR